ncbi:hypothetical protein [Mucilaginibacter celer]|uniref:SGNH/GDSL hydrolase family protein n=1 Tax=Mucilaginibacter celer TaxID=2305508 RepID=A0A494W1X8_9SPHI|nr:hypothetical protein [Mucilaginibacter celer]AYL97515.1 hypothetical protein HYN43_020395 [Mucilaginibacter celer]
MGRFLKKIFCFLLIGVAMAYLLQFAIDTGLRKSDYSADYKVWYDLMNSRINADILIQGSSRARIHISPALLESEFGMPAYNLGMSGTAFGLENYRFNQYIKHNKKPKYIIQVVDVTTFTNADEVEFVQFIPYLNKPLIEKFKGHFDYTLADLYVPLYKYRTAYGATTAGIRNIFRTSVADDGNYKGFCSYNRPFSNKSLLALKKKYPAGLKTRIVDSIYREFVDFVAYCKKENITLILVWVPSLDQYQAHVRDANNMPGLYSSLARKYGFKYFDYSSSPICRDTSMFFDYYHMNTKGVNAFGKYLVEDLKSVIH